MIENKIRSSSIFLQCLSESSCTPWNFQPGWVENQNTWEGFIKSLLSRAYLGTLNQDFWGRDLGKDILKKFPWWFPCTLLVKKNNSIDLKIRGLKKLWLVVKHLPWVANWEMYSLIKYLKYHRPQKTLSPSLSSVFFFLCICPLPSLFSIILIFLLQTIDVHFWKYRQEKKIKTHLESYRSKITLKFFIYSLTDIYTNIYLKVYLKHMLYMLFLTYFLTW